MSKPKPDGWYARLIKRYVAKRPLARNCAVAFLSGGLLCGLAELARFFLMQGGMSAETASAWVTWSVVVLTACATGLGVYDRAGQFCGAGLAVPISGFANSVAAAMLEHKYEGLVLGSGCNSFKLAGAVVVFGTASAFAAACVAWLLGVA